MELTNGKSIVVRQDREDIEGFRRERAEGGSDRKTRDRVTLRVLPGRSAAQSRYRSKRKQWPSSTRTPSRTGWNGYSGAFQVGMVFPADFSIKIISRTRPLFACEKCLNLISPFWRAVCEPSGLLAGKPEGEVLSVISSESDPYRYLARAIAIHFKR